MQFIRYRNRLLDSVADLQITSPIKLFICIYVCEITKSLHPEMHLPLADVITVSAESHTFITAVEHSLDLI